MIQTLQPRPTFGQLAVPPDDTPTPDPTTSTPTSPPPNVTAPNVTTPPPAVTPPTVPAHQPAAKKCRKAKCVALTFDDGPSADSGRLLDTLKAKGVKATFFVLGQRVKEHPAAVRRMVKEGHVVGNHSYSHPEFWPLKASVIASELTRTSKAIEHASGQKVTLLRPPYGECNDTVREVERELGLAQILWNVDSRDWATLDSAKTISTVLKQVKPGSIVLLHEIHQSTRDALPTLIDKLRKAGYTFVTVPELLGPTKPGVSYSQRK